jgi:hypothetical protein
LTSNAEKRAKRLQGVCDLSWISSLVFAGVVGDLVVEFEPGGLGLLDWAAPGFFLWLTFDLSYCSRLIKKARKEEGWMPWRQATDTPAPDSPSP